MEREVAWTHPLAFQVWLASRPGLEAVDPGWMVRACWVSLGCLQKRTKVTTNVQEGKCTHL